MVWSHFLREIDGRTTVDLEVSFRGRSATLTAHADPMALGPEWLSAFLKDRSGFRKLIVPDSAFDLAMLMPRGPDWPVLYQAWLEAAGLNEDKLLYLDVALNNLEAFEADLLRVYQGVDAREWFTGGLSSRRVAVLVGDLAKRPETLIGAELKKIVNPLTFGEIMLATSVAAVDGKAHPVFMTHEQRDLERLERESIARIQARGLSA